MRVGITGAQGFLGKNLSNHLNALGIDCISFNAAKDIRYYDDVKDFALGCDAIVHLAGCNRGNEEELLDTNVLGTYNIAKHCLKNNLKLIVSGSRNLLGYYGASKKICAKIVSNLNVLGLQGIYLSLPNVFGPECRPNYNSFVTTMMYNLANDLPYTINDTSTILRLIHSQDVCDNIEAMLKMPYLDVKHNLRWTNPNTKSFDLWNAGEFSISLGDFERALKGKSIKNERAMNLITKTFQWYKNNAEASRS